MLELIVIQPEFLQRGEFTDMMWLHQTSVSKIPKTVTTGLFLPAPRFHYPPGRASLAWWGVPGSRVATSRGFLAVPATAATWGSRNRTEGWWATCRWGLAQSDYEVGRTRGGAAGLDCCWSPPPAANVGSWYCPGCPECLRGDQKIKYRSHAPLQILME